MRFMKCRICECSPPCLCRMENNHEDPIQALLQIFSVKDRLDSTRSFESAWIYGIIMGYTPSEMTEVCEEFGWPESVRLRLEQLNINFRNLRKR